MPTLYVTEQGATVRREGERIVVRKGKEKLTEMPALHVNQVVLYGNAHVTTPAAAFLLDRGIETVFLSRYGQFRGRLQGAVSAGAEARRQQYVRASDPRFALRVARAIVCGKIVNQIILCRRRETQGLRTKAEEMERVRRLAAATPGFDALMGYEGTASRLYFEALRGMFREDWGFTSRVRRPPTDPVNILLSLGYTFLFKDMLSAIYLVGLDPYVGFLHVSRPGHATLASDLMEEFRTPVVDVVVQKVLNSRQVVREDFRPDEDGFIRVSDKGFRAFAQEYQNRLETEVVHPDAGGRTSYRRILELQVRRLTRALMEKQVDYIPFEMPR